MGERLGGDEQTLAELLRLVDERLGGLGAAARVGVDQVRVPGGLRVGLELVELLDRVLGQLLDDGVAVLVDAPRRRR